MSTQHVIQILAVFLAPIFALQVSQELTRRREARARKQHLFNTLMATRGALGTAGRMSFDHVRALNMIEIEWHGDDCEDEIVAAWRAYLHTLNNGPSAMWTPENAAEWETWNEQRSDKLVSLLYSMAKALEYKFDSNMIRELNYAPQGYLDADLEGLVVRRAVRELLDGQRAIHITAEPPVPPGAARTLPDAASEDAGSNAT